MAKGVSAFIRELSGDNFVTQAYVPSDGTWSCSGSDASTGESGSTSTFTNVTTLSTIDKIFSFPPPIEVAGKTTSFSKTENTPSTTTKTANCGNTSRSDADGEGLTH